ncbi:MAG TPA: LysR family transcriptional regulator [Dongiaceae bacterium]|nr:LysR family transcriptional regulator [Dongiaceae bacterium]
MEWSDLRIFLAIARTGTLGAAARQVGQTQPTMGRRLRALEQAVGQTLFQRTAEGFVLTEEGAAVLSHAERVEEEAIAFERQLAGQGGQIDGMLRVSSSDWFGAHVLTPIFTAFTKAHPRVTIELVTDQRLYSLARRNADMVFRIRPFDEPDVIQRKLLHMDYALYAADPKIKLTPGNGAGLSLVTMDSAFADLPDAVWLQRLFPKARIAYRSNNREAQAQACRAGAGLAVLPCLLGDRFPDLYRLKLKEAPPGRDVWVGYHRDLRQLARLRALLDATLVALEK